MEASYRTENSWYLIDRKMKFGSASICLIWMMAMSFASCDKIDIPAVDLSRRLTVEAQHAPTDQYFIQLIMNGTDTVAAWDTLGDVSVQIAAQVGDVLYYRTNTNSNLGAVLQISEQDSLLLLYLNMSGIGLKTASGFITVQY